MTKRTKARESKRPLTTPGAPIGSSAGNHFSGEVKSVVVGAVNAEVGITLPSGLEMVASITNDSVRRLALEKGRPITVMVKASSVLLATGDGIVSSARNALGGTVTAVREGAVNGEVRLGLSGGEEITAIVTNGSIRHLGLEPGVRVTALIKASSVLLAVA